MRLKKMLMGMLVGTMVFGMVGCGEKKDSEADKKVENEVEQDADKEESASEGTDGDYTVGVILKTTSSEYWGYVQAGAVAAGKELGIKVDVIGPASETSYDEQNSAIENYISSGQYDAIAIAPLQPDSVGTVIGETNIPILFLDTDASYDKKVSYIGTGNYEAAYKGAEYALEQAGDDVGNIVILSAVQGNATTTARETGAVDAFKAAGHEVAAIQNADGLADKATEKMENILTSLNNEVSIVCCGNDEMAAGAAKAIAQAGIEDVIIVGFDGIQSGVQNVIDGVVTATVAQSPYRMGYMTVESALKTIKGESVEASIDTGIEVVDKSNAEAYLAELKGMLEK